VEQALILAGAREQAAAQSSIVPTSAAIPVADCPRLRLAASPFPITPLRKIGEGASASLVGAEHHRDITPRNSSTADTLRTRLRLNGNSMASEIHPHFPGHPGCAGAPHWPERDAAYIYYVMELGDDGVGQSIDQRPIPRNLTRAEKP
jgi:hypothetical protein